MNKNLSKKVTAAVLSCCLIVPMSAVYAAEPATVTADDTVMTASGIVPFSKYLKSSTVSLNKSTTTMYVEVSTKAFQKVDHIYHDVTVFKNGVLYSSGRYDDYNAASLSTTIKVDAVSGDYIDVYVDHYTAHGGVVESKSTSNAKYF